MQKKKNENSGVGRCGMAAGPGSTVAELLKAVRASTNKAAKTRHGDAQEHKEAASEQLEAIPVPVLEKGRSCCSR